MPGRVFCSVLLNVCIVTAPATLALSEMWACSQSDGTDLFTDRGGPGCKRLGDKGQDQATKSPPHTSSGSPPFPRLPSSPSSTTDYWSGVAAYQRGDYDAALLEFRPAAEQGNANAQYYLGSMYEMGEGVPKNNAQAFHWYKLAGDNGNSAGQARAGWMSYQGQGVPKNFVEAFRWFRLAAEQGHTGAMNMLGSMYFSGTGVPQDSGKAYKLWSLTASQEHSTGQFNLGIFHRGEGSSQGNVLAYMWFELSSSHGDGNSFNAQRELKALTKRMAPAEIAEARKRVKVWKPQHLTDHELGSQAKLILASASPSPSLPKTTPTLSGQSQPEGRGPEEPPSPPPATQPPTTAAPDQGNPPMGRIRPVKTGPADPIRSEWDELIKTLEGQETIPWIALAILAGLVIYYKTRTNRCPYCEKELTGQGSICLSCGRRLRFRI